MREKSDRIREAVADMDSRKVDFEYDGEMSADVALNEELLKLYPFCRLSAPANVLIMPALHSAHIASNMLAELGGGTTIGPILCGMDKPVQIVQMDASVSDIINLSAVAAIDAIDAQRDGRTRRGNTGGCTVKAGKKTIKKKPGAAGK
jgi:malate dehydrogenase (oxaloacetate-decarboxylating)(NADP+)